MTYFDPKIYNKQNLKSEDRKELEYWNDVFHHVIYNAQFNYRLDNITGSDTLDKIVGEVIEGFCKQLGRDLGHAMQDSLVGCIDNYEEGAVSEVENPETFVDEESED